MPKPKPDNPSPPSSTELLTVALERLVPTAENPRKFRNDAAFKTLTASIIEDGILEPLLVRPMSQATSCCKLNDHDNLLRYSGPSKSHQGQPAADLFDVRSGRRRYEAAKKAKLKEVPVVVRDMDDLTALRVTIKENLDRENLTPLEEARGIQSYLDRGLTPEQVATEFGRTASWVARRANLLKLTENWRARLVPEDDCAPGDRAQLENYPQRWSVASLELVAALGADEQDKLLKHLDTHGQHLQTGRPHEIQSVIAYEFTHQLVKAPWALDDAVLCPKAGACTACTARSGASPLLWDGLEEQDLTKTDRCLRPSCWDQKTKAYAARELTALKEKHPDLVAVNTDYIGNHPTKAAARKQEVPQYHHYEVTECKKSDKGAVPAVKITENGLAPRVTYVRPNSVTQDRTISPPVPDKECTLAELRTELGARRKEWAVEKWCNYINDNFDALLEKAKLPSDEELLLLRHAFVSSLDAPDDPLTILQRHDVDAARVYFFSSIIDGVLDTRHRPDCDMIKVCVHIDGLLAGTDAPMILDMLARAATEIPEPTGWAERERAEASPRKEEQPTVDAPSPKAKRARRRPSKQSRQPKKTHRPDLGDRRASHTRAKRRTISAGRSQKRKTKK